MVLNQFRMIDPFHNLMKIMNYSSKKWNHRILYGISKALRTTWSLFMNSSGTYYLYTENFYN